MAGGPFYNSLGPIPTTTTICQMDNILGMLVTALKAPNFEMPVFFLHAGLKNTTNIRFIERGLVVICYAVDIRYRVIPNFANILFQI